MTSEPSIFISTAPFAETDSRPIELLNRLGVPYRMNPLGRRLTDLELTTYLGGVTVLIAGTEPINRTVFDAAPELKLISRVGTGVDSVDLNLAKSRGIQVCHTPDAPALAVAELTIGLMLSLLRGVHRADQSVRQGKWTRIFGRRLAAVTVGVIGVGRIGRKLIYQLTAGFPGIKILANDIVKTDEFTNMESVTWVDKEELFRQSDIVTLHLPSTPRTRFLVNKDVLGLMKPDSFLINTSRGDVVVESDLERCLQNKEIAGAALDVFEHEPYSGGLRSLTNCLFTCHMGSMTLDCRVRMEVEAVEEAVSFLNNTPLKRVVPDSEYISQLGLRSL